MKKPKFDEVDSYFNKKLNINKKEFKNFRQALAVSYSDTRKKYGYVPAKGKRLVR